MENTQNTQSTINAAAESTAVAQSPVIVAKAESKPKRAYHRLTDEEKAQRAKDFEADKAGVAERKAKRAEKKASEELEEARALAVKVEEKPVVTHIRTGEGGRTFGTVSSKEIAAAAKQQLGLELDKKKISLPEALKNLGTYEVSVKLHKEVTATLRVKVEAE